MIVEGIAVGDLQSRIADEAKSLQGDVRSALEFVANRARAAWREADWTTVAACFLVWMDVIARVVPYKPEFGFVSHFGRLHQFYHDWFPAFVTQLYPWNDTDASRVFLLAIAGLKANLNRAGFGV